MSPTPLRTDKLNVDGSLGLWAGLFVAVFLALEIASIAFGVDPLTFVVPALVLTLTMMIVCYSVFRQARFRRYNDAWYRSTFPGAIRRDGQVHCRHCGGTHLDVRSLVRPTGTRAHSCSQCRQTLYYSADT